MPAKFLKAAPYQNDIMALPVGDVDSAAPGVTDTQTFEGRQFRVFFVVAPDGLCSMLASPVK